MKTFSEHISVVLPFFRAEQFIAEAIESVLGQRGFDDWRLYLVNDGSDELDSEIAQQYCRRYPNRMQLLQHEGRVRCGASASRNLGIGHARGSLIAFLDADDVWYPHKLRSQTAILKRHPSAVMVYGPALRWYSWAGGEDVEVPVSVDGFGSDCVVPGAALLDTYLREESLTPCTGSVLIRRTALDAVGVFENQFWGLFDDQVLYAKLCFHGEVYVSSDCVSRYRQHKLSCCAQAVAQGQVEIERVHFLRWLNGYRKQQAKHSSELAAASAPINLAFDQL